MLVVVLVVLVLKVVEIVLERPSLVKQQVEVVEADKHLMHLRGDIHRLVLVEDCAIVLQFLEVLKSAHHQQSQAPEGHLLQVVVLDNEGGEVVAGHLVEEGVRTHAVGGVEQDKHVRLVEVVGKRCELLCDVAGAVVGQTCRPQHAARVVATATQSAPGVQALGDSRRHRRDVGLGIALQHLLEHLFKLVVVALGEITQCVNPHKLGHDFAERILAHHLGVSLVHGVVVVGQVVGVCHLVHLLLLVEHVLQVVEVVGVLKGFAILRVGKLLDDELPVSFGLAHTVGAHIHQVHVVVHVEAVGVVGVTPQQLQELRRAGVVVLEFVLENQAHVVESLLDNLVGGLDLLLGARYLLEVVFLEVRVLAAAPHLGVDGNGVAVSVDHEAVAHDSGGVGSGDVVVKRECGLVAAAPVVLEFAVTPRLLERCLAGILRGGVVEVPRAVVINLETGWRVGRSVVVQLVAARVLVGKVGLAVSIFLLFFLLFLEFVDDFLNHRLHLSIAHLRQAQQRVLKGNVLRVHGEFVKHVAAVLQFLIVGVVLVN